MANQLDNCNQNNHVTAAFRESCLLHCVLLFTTLLDTEQRSCSDADYHTGQSMDDRNVPRFTLGRKCLSQNILRVKHPTYT